MPEIPINRHLQRLSDIDKSHAIKSIGGDAFFGCTGLENLEVDTGNENYASDNGILYHKGDAMLIRCPAQKTGNVTIPEGVTAIGNLAFDGCGILVSITMPKSMTDIGMEAFADCSSLENIIIPEKVAAIGSGAFYGCSSLKSITLKQRWY